MENIIAEGFKKVAEHGGTYVVAVFYNPTTKEVKSECVRDYDYADCSRDNDELYYMQIDEDARREWLHNSGTILVGDYAEVVKGRTIAHGFIGKVKAIKAYKDRYNRWLADYIYFEEGGKINAANCKLVVA